MVIKTLFGSSLYVEKGAQYLKPYLVYKLRAGTKNGNEPASL